MIGSVPPSVVYAICNAEGGIVYIGRTQQWPERPWQHKGQGSPVGLWMRENPWEHRVLETCKTWAEAGRVERRRIEEARRDGEPIINVWPYPLCLGCLKSQHCRCPKVKDEA